MGCCLTVAACYLRRQRKHDRHSALNPEDIVQLGPLAIALDRLVAIALILAFLSGLDWIVRRYRVKAWQPAFLALFAGLVAARIGHVWEYRESYALEPIAALQAWLGGWNWLAGVAAAAVVIALTLRSPRSASAALGLLGALSLIWLGFVSLGGDRPALRLPPDLVLERLATAEGAAGPLRLSDLRGRPAVINLWATWCPPCRREMPMLTQTARTEQRVAIVMANQGEKAEQVSTYLRSQGLDPAHVALDPSGQLGSMVKLGALPTTIFVDREGKVRQVHTGEINRVQLDIAIRALDRAS